MHQLTLLHVGENAKASLRRDEATDNLLCHILSRRSEQILELDAAKFLNNGRLLLNRVLETRFKLVEFALFLVKVLNETTAPFLHLIEATLQADPVWRLVTLAVLNLITGDWVL